MPEASYTDVLSENEPRNQLILSELSQVYYLARRIAIVDRLLGGSASPSEPSREVTEIEDQHLRLYSPRHSTAGSD